MYIKSVVIVFIDNIINVRENRRLDREWTIQKHGQHWTQDTEQS